MFENILTRTYIRDNIKTTKGGINMMFLKENKELLIFYLCVTIVTMFWVSKVDRENDFMMQQKSYVISEAR